MQYFTGKLISFLHQGCKIKVRPGESAASPGDETPVSSIRVPWFDSGSGFLLIQIPEKQRGWFNNGVSAINMQNLD